jgi:uncharacterized membrane protein
LATIFIILVLVAACDDTIKVTDLDNVKIPSSNISYAQYIQPVFTAKCTFSGCHNDQDVASGLSVTSWTNARSNYQIVAPFYPQNSRLIWRIEGTSGTIMPPLIYWGLTQNQRDGITTWVKEGAKNN